MGDIDAAACSKNTLPKSVIRKRETGREGRTWMERQSEGGRECQGGTPRTCETDYTEPAHRVLLYEVAVRCTSIDSITLFVCSIKFR